MEEAWNALEAAVAAKDEQAFTAARQRMGEACAATTLDRDVWDELRDTLRTLAALVRIESRRRVTMKQMIQTSEAVAFARALVVAVLNHEPDPHIRARIQEDMARALQLSGFDIGQDADC